MMDPIGFLENFDAVGRWRTEQFGEKLVVAGELVDGTAFEGQAGLRQLF
jgi:hypothetical protein